MNDFTLLKTIKVKNLLGECILWDELSQQLWWTDILGARLYRYHFHDEKLEDFALPERLGSFGFVRNDPRLICAFASGFALYEPKTAQIEWLYRPEAGFSGTRFNDGRCDRQGRFWAGTMVEAATAKDAEQRNVQGALYWVAAKDQGKALEHIRISNSLCWSPDSGTVYFADSPTREICAFDFDTASASFTNKRVFAITPDGSVPDGSIIDAEAHLWNAHWGGGKVVRYSPQGLPVSVMELPVTQPTCVCLGGPDMNLLFVTTALTGLSDAQLKAQPEAGNVFVFKTTCKGLHESRFEK